MKCRAECGAVRNCMRVDVDGNIYGFGVDGWKQYISKQYIWIQFPWMQCRWMQCRWMQYI